MVSYFHIGSLRLKKYTHGAIMKNSRVVSVKMADNDIDLYADDIDQDFAQVSTLLTPYY